MTSSTPIADTRSIRRKRERNARRLRGAALGSAVLGAACIVGSFALPGDSALANGDASVADLAAAQAQEYTTTLVSGTDPGRDGTLAATAIDPTDKNELKAIAADMIVAYGWGATEMQCLDLLWEKESGWNPLAENPSSGAYGIPQSWPADKLATAGDDWRTNPITQMTWGMDYIAAVYGDPCVAWYQHDGSY